MTEPAQPPSSPPEDVREPRHPGPLYTVNAVVMATVIGSLMAGVVLMALNYLTLGRRELAWRVLRLGLATFVVLMVGAYLLPPDSVVRLLMVPLQALVAGIASVLLQGPRIRYHLDHGGKAHSLWRAAGVALLTALVVMFVLTLLTALGIAVTGGPPNGAPVSGELR